MTQDYGPVSLDSVDALTLNWNQIQWLVYTITTVIAIIVIFISNLHLQGGVNRIAWHSNDRWKIRSRRLRSCEKSTTSFTTRSPGLRLPHHHKTISPHNHKTRSPHKHKTISPHHQVHNHHITSPQDKITGAPCHQITTGSQDPQISRSTGPRFN